MKKIFYALQYNVIVAFIFLAIITLIVSCSKNDSPVTPPPPAAATIATVTSPTGTNSGAKNTIITITGTNFITDLSKIQVKVNGKDCIVLTATATAITARIPPSCGTGIVELFLNGTRYAGPIFNFVYSLTLTSITDGQVGNVYGPIATAKFDYIDGITIDQGNNIFLGQWNSPKVKKISSAGIVSLLAGSGVVGGANGNGANAQFYGPEYTSAAADGNLYVADGVSIRKIDAAGNVTTLYTSSLSSNFWGIKAMPTGIYVGGEETLEKISYSGAIIWRIKTKSDITYDTDGDTSVVKFHTYGNIEVDSTEQNIYFINNNWTGNLNGHGIWKLKKLNIASHTISTVAGSDTGTEAFDGPALQATFNYLSDVKFDKNNNLVLADRSNHKIRVLSNGTVSTLLGSAGFGDVDGDAIVGKIKLPTGIAFDSNGNLFIACYGNNKIKKLTMD